MWQKTVVVNSIELPISQQGDQGKKFSFRVETNPRLELAINDTHWDDNSGKLDARLIVKKGEVLIL